MVRKSIRNMLEKDPRLEVVGDVANGAEGVEMTRRFRPDIVLMDIEMPVLNGIEATKQIMREVPGTKVIMLTMYDEETHDLQAYSAGAVGYVHKNADPDDLLLAVHSVAMGHLHLSPQSTRRVLNELQGAGHNGQSSTSSEALTEREKALLSYLTAGLSGKEIAGELGLSEGRVRTLLSKLYAKIGVNGQAPAAAYAVEKKLI